MNQLLNWTLHKRQTELQKANIIDFPHDHFLVRTLQGANEVISHVPEQRGPLSEFPAYILAHTCQNTP